MCAIRNTFKAYERLKREQHIDTLFRTGKAFSVFPLKVIYLLQPRGAELSPVRAGFSVPKKKWRSSVKRHRIRRLMVEAWRLNKQPVYQAVPGDSQLHLFFLYTDATLPTQEDVTELIIKLADKLVKELSLVSS